MFFNSPEYIFFLCLVFVLVLLTNRTRTLQIRNFLLLVASYVFYAQLHIWFVLLLVYTTLVNYGCGRWISYARQKHKNAKIPVTVGIVLSLAILVVFKYAYIVDTSIILPVGLSFFTFQALSYTIDIYRGKIVAEKSLLNVALFIAFFPTLLSGPIERARNLIPQLKQPTAITSEIVFSGIGLFIWGLFKKVVIADRLAEFVNAVYAAPAGQTGSTLALAAVFYSFQIYCDFSGYADMAIGSGKILGFDIMKNFNFPYFANTIKEFWRRWHISLTSWFTEYVYFSMGGNRVKQARWILNISTVFLLSGIWHGATWGFVLWGLIHAVLYLIEHFCKIKHPNLLNQVLVFILVTFAWIFFRIENSATAWNVICTICTDIVSPINWGSSTFSTLLTIVLLVLFIAREYLMYKQKLPQKHILEYMLLIFGICLFGVSSDQFVYFQF